jgi:hypothetical protein
MMRRVLESRIIQLAVEGDAIAFTEAITTAGTDARRNSHLDTTGIAW